MAYKEFIVVCSPIQFKCTDTNLTMHCIHFGHIHAKSKNNKPRPLRFKHHRLGVFLIITVQCCFEFEGSYLGFMGCMAFQQLGCTPH